MHWTWRLAEAAGRRDAAGWVRAGWVRAGMGAARMLRLALAAQGIA